ncbi:DNA-binding response OmpR family regulator [Tumebacillus sp. BK434]|uniref:response regulator transcription factor n=1 Tax=Tumebacillus sp. BK434 TaxID=2512169 RepID=UPI00104BD934|nr:response regulator transcription factor [Tumebacillus sp. BK434]TCP59094.1 DNA-binding response OmpR family regulator [Tumebacillus sp. BK434]
MEKERILIVDDEKEIRDLIEIYLKNEGYRVLQAENGAEALALLEETAVDLIILDIMMPQLDGLTFTLQVREKQDMPIIMLSAKTQDMDKIHGLSTGADDYMTKPFNPMELIARVKSQLRRMQRLNKAVAVPVAADVIEIDDLQINTVTHEVRIGGTEVRLTPTEFDILALLARNRGKVFSAEHIYESVWQEQYYRSGDNTVMVHIRKIREKIEENSRKPKYIKTVWGVGYKIET